VPFLLLAGSAVFAATTLVVRAKTDDPGGRWGNTVQIIARWQRPMASNVAQDVLHWAMCLVLQRWIAKAIKTANSQRMRCICLPLPIFCHV